VAGRAPVEPAPPAEPPRRGWLGGFLQFLREHPVVCLAILTPGIVEYLSTSSSLLLLVESPVLFLIFLAVNVGQYTAGALLIREARIRWGKGWATVGLLGLAYGITEEGLGDNTLFRNTHHADGVLGWYGHFLGVNWVWSVGVLLLHVTVSIAFPIILLGLALPSTRGRSLIGRRGIAVAFLTLIGSTTFEAVTVYGEFSFWMGPALFAGSLVAIALLVLAAYRAPAELGLARPVRATGGPGEMFALGFVLFVIAFVVEYGSAAVNVAPAVAIAIELLLIGAWAVWVRRRLGRVGNEYLLVNLAFGLVLFEGVFGVLITLGLPYTLPLVALVVVFFVRLRRRYAPRPGRGPSPPPGARGDIGSTI
jgi:hypothetical protein